MLDPELVPKELFEFPTPRVAVLLATDEHVRRECREAARDRPDVEIVHLPDARHGDHRAPDVLSVDPAGLNANGPCYNPSISGDGKHVSFVSDVSFPAHFDIRGEVLLVPDLHARVSLFDKENKVIAHLGYDPEWTKKALDAGLAVSESPSWTNTVNS